jgi:hypothetical protein
MKKIILPYLSKMSDEKHYIICDDNIFMKLLGWQMDFVKNETIEDLEKNKLFFEISNRIYKDLINNHRFNKFSLRDTTYFFDLAFYEDEKEKLEALKKDNMIYNLNSKKELYKYYLETSLEENEIDWLKIKIEELEKAVN